jgi:hypothetical protein
MPTRRRGFPTTWAAAPARTETAAEERFATYVLPEVEVMMRVALSLTRNKADAEDLVQDTLVRAFKAIERFEVVTYRRIKVTLGRVEPEIDQASIDRLRAFGERLAAGNVALGDDAEGA